MKELSLEIRAKVFEHLVKAEEPLDSMQLMRMDAKPGVLSYDWHAYLKYLEDLTGRGLLMRDGISKDGHQKYSINYF